MSSLKIVEVLRDLSLRAGAVEFLVERLSEAFDGNGDMEVPEARLALSWGVGLVVESIVAFHLAGKAAHWSARKGTPEGELLEAMLAFKAERLKVEALCAGDPCGIAGVRALFSSLRATSWALVPA